MAISKLQYENSGVSIQFFAPNGLDRNMLIGEILPMIDGTFYINSNHLKTKLNTYYKSTKIAKEEAQKLFEIWVNNFYCA